MKRYFLFPRSPIICVSLVLFCIGIVSSQCEAGVLRKGDKGADVLAAQVLLIEYGYLEAKADGEFGSLTEAAVKRFQSEAGITADGVLNDRTKKRLKETDEDALASFIPLKPGAKGDYVFKAQHFLRYLGHFNEEITGIYGRTTEDAIKAFQSEQNIEIDGICGRITYKILRDAAAKNVYGGNLFSASPKLKDTVSSKGNFKVLKIGMRGDAVKNMQQLLIDCGYLKENADGVFGSKTKYALMRFQRDANLEADGVYGVVSFEALNSGNYHAKETGDAQGTPMMVYATAYSAQDTGNNSRTATGTRVRYGVIAVDPAVIPLGTRVYIPGYGEAVAEDTGGFKGAHIDIAFETRAEALAFGRQHIEIYILD